MNNKSLSIVSYITIIGWLIAYFSYKDRPEKSPLVNYHLEQSLGFFIVCLILSVATSILVSILPSLGILVSIVGIIELVLLIMGIINAANEAMRPIPVVGKFFEKKFGFLA